MAQDVLSDGFVKLCIDPSLNFSDGKCRVLLEGQYIPSLTTPVPADVIIKVNGLRNVETMFGAGSVLSESIKRVLCACEDQIDLYVLPRLDAEDAVSAVYTLTVTGPATSDGRFTLFAGDSAYDIDILVESGDNAATIAAAIAAAFTSAFPFTVTATAGVVTFTAKNGGTVGNHLNLVYNWAGRSNYAPTGVTVAFAQTVQGATDPTGPAAGYRDIIGQCCYSCYALLSDNNAWQTAMRDHIRDAWDCSKPQCFGHGYTYNSGTVGQIIARGDNSMEWSRLACHTDDPLLPYLKVANYAALSCCTACSSPELSIQGPTNGLLTCVAMPESCSALFSWDDITALQDAGFVVTGPANTGSGTLTNPYIFNDVTNYLFDDLGRDNQTYRATSSVRLATSTALSLATKLQEFNGVALFTKNTNVARGVRGTNPRLILASIRAWATANIGILFSEFDNMDTDITLQTDFEVAQRCAGVPGRLHLNVKYRPPVRISDFDVNMQPALLDNCNR